jgi:hypothetical protein
VNDARSQLPVPVDCPPAGLNFGETPGHPISDWLRHHRPLHRLPMKTSQNRVDPSNPAKAPCAAVRLGRDQGERYFVLLEQRVAYHWPPPVLLVRMTAGHNAPPRIRSRPKARIRHPHRPAHRPARGWVLIRSNVGRRAAALHRVGDRDADRAAGRRA